MQKYLVRTLSSGSFQEGNRWHLQILVMQGTQCRFKLKQMVKSQWYGQICTQKIEEEALNSNQAILNRQEWAQEGSFKDWS